MAVVLPTITVTDAQAARIIAAFGADQTSAVANYTNWLTAGLIDFVLRHETRIVVEQNQAALEAAIASIVASLPPAPTNPVVP